MKIYGSIIEDRGNFGSRTRLLEKETLSYIDKYLPGAMRYKRQGECPDEYIREIKKKKDRVNDHLVGLWIGYKIVSLIVVLDKYEHVSIAVMFDHEKDKDDYLRSFMV